MHRTIGRRSLVLTLLPLVGLALSAAAQVQQPSKDRVAFKVVAKSKVDVAASYVIPLAPPKSFTKLMGTAEGATATEFICNFDGMISAPK